MKDRVLGVLFMAGVFALLGMGVREYLIHNGRLTSDLNADGHSITNLPDGFFPTNGFLRTHQDISGKADKSDTYTKSETDAKIVELSPAPGNYSAVSNAAMSAAAQTNDFLRLSGGTMTGSITVGGDGAYVRLSNPANSLTPGFEVVGAYSHLKVFPSYIERLNEAGNTYYFTFPNSSGLLATTSDIEEAVRGIVIPAPDLSEYAKLYTVSALANFATNVDAKASTAISYLQGDDAKVVITNYDSSVSMPSMSFQQRIDEGGSNWWKVVWNELTRWEWLTGTYLPANYYGKSQIDVLLDEKADRAWGYYDSHGGNYAPDGYTWISSPKIAIAAGLAYQRTVTSGGAIWVLESNGLVTETGGNLTNGFFRVSDDEGNSLLEIVKGNKRTIGANAEQPAVSNIMGVTHMYIRYSVVSESHPTLNICTALELGDWHDETSADCAANVSWTGSSGAYVAEVWGKTALTRMFVKAEYEVGGETYIKNSAPISADGGIYCTDGIHKVRFVYNNGSVTMEVTP